MDNQEITDRFMAHGVDEANGLKIGAVGGNFIDFAHTLNALLPESREKSLVMTKLEEAKMWAIKSIARSQE